LIVNSNADQQEHGNTYHIAGMFGGGKVWQILQVVRDSPNFNQPILADKWYSYGQIYPFAKLYFVNYF